MPKVASPHTISVGDTLYSYNPYPRNNKPNWTPNKIIGETKVSWLLEPEWSPTKCNKKTMSTVREPSHPMYFTESGMKREIWLKNNAQRIGTAVSFCKSVEALLIIAKLVDCKVLD